MEIHICSITEYDANTRVPTIVNPNSSTFYLVPTEDGTSPDLFTEWVYVNNAWEMFGSMKIDLSGYLTDVQVNGTSIVTDGVANVPIASYAKLGAVKVTGSDGVRVAANGDLCIYSSQDSVYKAGSNQYAPVTALKQHAATFYGLAKAAGADENNSVLTVGNYTDNAKDAIQNMLGITPLIAPHESDPFESNHVIGELFIIGGKLYRAKTTLTAGEYINEDVNVEVVNVAGVMDEKVEDVKINGSSIVSDGVAEIPIGQNNLGVVTQAGMGVIVDSLGRLKLSSAAANAVKTGTTPYSAITPANQESATFYGFAKAAGDTTQSVSSNEIGQYTDEAKTAIKTMLGVHDTYDSFIEEVTGTDPTITGQPSYRYNCGEVYTLTITPPSSGTIDVRFTSGSTPTVLTLPSTVKMPEWWVEVEANTIYEMYITDGIYCGVMSWAI